MPSTHFNQLRQQTAQWFSESRFAYLEKFFDDLYPKWRNAHDKDALLHEELLTSFLKIEPFVAHLDGNAQRASQLLQQWEAQRPCYYSAYLQACFWETLAVQARGEDWANTVSEQGWQRAEIAKDNAFYWYLTACERRSDCPLPYSAMMRLSGFLSQPKWLWQDTFPQAESLYSADAIEAVHQFDSNAPQMRYAPAHLPEPNEAEQEYALRYWLNRVLERDAYHLSALKNYVYYLYPRWYGDDEYQAIDNFLAEPVCQQLPKSYYNALIFEKYMDKLGCNLPDFNDHDTIAQYQSDFEYLNTLELPPYTHYLLQLSYMQFCDRYLRDEDDNVHPFAEAYTHKIMALAETVLLKHRHFLLDDGRNNQDNFVGMVCWQFVRPEPMVRDDTQLCHRIITLLYPYQSPFIQTLAGGASMAQAWGFSQHEFEPDWAKIVERDDPDADYDAINAIRYLFHAQLNDVAYQLLQKFDELEHGQASYRLYQLHNGQHYGNHDHFAEYREPKRADEFLHKAVERHYPDALEQFGVSESERLCDQTVRATPEVNRALAVLEEAVFLHRRVPVYSAYIRLRYETESPERILELLERAVPFLMYQARGNFEPSDWAWIAHIYALACGNGSYGQDNLFMAQFWAEQARVLEPDNAVYQNLYEHWHTPQGWLFARSRFEKKLADSRANIPHWLLDVAWTFLEWSESETQKDLPALKSAEQDESGQL